MLLDSGIARIWRGRIISPAGAVPEKIYDLKYFESYYGEKTVGLNRFYTAKAYNDRADLIIEIQRKSGISTADRCELLPCFDSEVAGVYKILLVQQVLDGNGQPATDLTLERIEAIQNG